MGCCGGHSGKVRAVGKIVSGHANRLFDQVFMVRGKRYRRAEQRQAVCMACEFQTWLTKSEYLAWLAANGIEVLTHIDDLTRLPMLDKHGFARGRSLFCRLCKCWIPAKAYSKDSQCPQDKWAD